MWQARRLWDKAKNDRNKLKIGVLVLSTELKWTGEIQFDLRLTEHKLKMTRTHNSTGENYEQHFGIRR